MDSAIEKVLRDYDQRAEAEMKRMREMPPAEMTKHIDEFLLPVGPATGQLMNILVFATNVVAVSTKSCCALQRWNCSLSSRVFQWA